MKSVHYENSQLRIGFFSIGLSAYWDQFEGLLERLNGHAEVITSRLERDSIEVVNLGMIDTVDKAIEAGHRFRQMDVDLLLLYVSTYALSATVLPLVRRVGVPVIILNLAPEAAIDYARFNRLQDRTAMTGEWLAYCQSCPVPEIANVFRRSHIPFFQVTGTLEAHDEAWKELNEWIEAALVMHRMAHNRLGLMGHYYSGMLDIYSDLTLQSATFGTHFEMIEVDELSAFRRELPDSAIESRVQLFREEFDVQPDVSEHELVRAARTSVALDELVQHHRLGSLAYFYKGVGTENEDVISSIILGNSYLTSRGIPVAGEFEIKNVQAMKILDSFGAGGSFTEYYATDFKDDVVLMGHDGPGHYAIANGKARVRPLRVYHGKVGHGLSIEMSVRHGPVTLLSVAEGETDELKLVVAEGESVSGPILEIGNTNSRYRFSIGSRRFIESWNAEGPAHHCAIGVGHISSKLTKLASLLGIKCVRIC